MRCSFLPGNGGMPGSTRAGGGGGGGGAGLGGAVFVQQGGSLTLAGSFSVNGNIVTGGNGGQAGLYVVFAKTDPSAGSKGVTAFLVEPSFPGFRVARYEDKMGLRTSRSAEITFTDCDADHSRLGGQASNKGQLHFDGMFRQVSLAALWAPKELYRAADESARVTTANLISEIR